MISLLALLPPCSFQRRLFWIVLAFFSFLAPSTAQPPPAAPPPPSIRAPQPLPLRPSSAAPSPTSLQPSSAAPPRPSAQATALATSRPLPHESLLTTKHLRFLFPAEWRPFATFLHASAEADLARIASGLGIQPSQAIVIRMAFAGPEFSAIQPSSRIPHPSVAGLAYPDRRLITLRILPAEGKDRLRQTFLHEISHILLYEAAQQRGLPLWFVEGVAMLQSDDLASLERFLLITQARWFGSIPQPDQLSQTWPRDQAGLSLAYAISYDLVSFLRSKDPTFLPKMTAFLRQGIAFDTALSLIFRRSWPTVVREWQIHLRQTYSYWALLSSEIVWALLLIPLVLLSWRRIRRQRLEQLHEMERLEAIEDALLQRSPPSETSIPPQNSALSPPSETSIPPQSSALSPPSETSTPRQGSPVASGEKPTLPPLP